jgi:hypothetical protein
MLRTKNGRPKWISHQQLASIGLTLVRYSPLVVQCSTCGIEWRPMRLPRVRWWLCYNGCNSSSEE